MALFIADSFDLYNSTDIAETWVYGPWTGYSLWPQSTISLSNRFGVGKSGLLGINGTQCGIYKTFASNTSNTIYLSVAVYSLSPTSGSGSNKFYFDFNQGGTNQVTVAFALNGTLNVYRNGTYLGGAAAFYSGQTWTHFQIKVVIDPSAGEVRIRKNGNTSDDFALTGVNTRATANSYINQLNVGSYGTDGGTLFDDLIMVDSSGSTLNTWTGDVRCYALPPSGAGSAADFTANGLSRYSYNVSGSSQTLDGNYIRTSPFYPIDTISLGSAAVYLASGFTGSLIVGVYSDNGSNAPGSLIATSNAITNPVPGANTLTFSSPPTLTRGTKYWMATNGSATCSAYAVSGGGILMARTYNGTMPTTISNQGSTYSTYISLSPVSNPNATSVMNNDTDTSYTSSSTVNAHDLLAMADLPTTPASILAVQQRVVARKSDAGSRSLQTELKSGATTVQGTSTALGSSYGTLITTYETDPATSAAWTASAVNALEAGYKVSS